MRRDDAPFDDWAWGTSCEAGPSDGHDDVAAIFRRLPPTVQARVHRRLLDGCLRALAASHGLWGRACVMSLSASRDERRALEHMCGTLLTTAALDVH